MSEEEETFFGMSGIGFVRKRKKEKHRQATLEAEREKLERDANIL